MIVTSNVVGDIKQICDLVWSCAGKGLGGFRRSYRQGRIESKTFLGQKEERLVKGKVILRGRVDKA